jgi:hypothetical protein
LSERNNHPDKAIEALEQALSGFRVKVLVGDQNCALPMMDVTV